MLASVIPNCVAPMYESMFAITFRATFARRLPLAASASNCVSRIRTSANSAATKNPFNTTSASTASTFNPSSVRVSPFISQAHLTKNKFQDISQRDDPDLPLVAAQNHRQPLAAALDSLQCVLQSQILLHI